MYLEAVFPIALVYSVVGEPEELRVEAVFDQLVQPFHILCLLLAFGLISSFFRFRTILLLQP